MLESLVFSSYKNILVCPLRDSGLLRTLRQRWSRTELVYYKLRKYLRDYIKYKSFTGECYTWYLIGSDS